MSKTPYCEVAGKARSCVDCAYAPWNQKGEPKGPSIRPAVRSNLMCPQWKAAAGERK